MCACLMSEDGSYYYVTLCTLCSSFFENVVEEESSRVSGKIIWRERKGERERERGCLARASRCFRYIISTFDFAISLEMTLQLCINYSFLLFYLGVAVLIL